jgi:hypothetical protein
LRLQAGQSLTQRSSIASCSGPVQAPAGISRIPQNRQSCKRAAAVAQAASNSNAAGSQAQQQHISIIASDVDGTLLNSQQQLTPGVEAAVKQAAEAGVPVRHCLIVTFCFSLSMCLGSSSTLIWFSSTAANNCMI